MKKMFLIYDIRALADVDEAEVLDTADSLKEAVEVARHENGVVYSYDDKNGNLVNGELVWLKGINK